MELYLLANEDALKREVAMRMNQYYSKLRQSTLERLRHILLA